MVKIKDKRTKRFELHVGEYFTPDHLYLIGAKLTTIIEGSLYAIDVPTNSSSFSIRYNGDDDDGLYTVFYRGSDKYEDDDTWSEKSSGSDFLTLSTCGAWEIYISDSSD